MGHVGVQLLLGTLIIVTFPLKLDPQPMGDGLDALGPDGLVEFGVESDVGGAHGLLGKVDDGLDGPGSALFEGAAVDALVEVDGVFAGHDILERRASLAACLWFWMSLDGRSIVSVRVRTFFLVSVGACGVMS